MRFFIYILIFFTISCSNRKEIKGDWKVNALYADNKKLPNIPKFPLIFFKSDNYVIYFDKLMVYNLKKDSLFLAYDEDHSKIMQKLRIEFIDDNNFALHYNRYLRNDEDSIINIIPYKSTWSKIN